jgi:hypothetical protein
MAGFAVKAKTIVANNAAITAGIRRNSWAPGLEDPLDALRYVFLGLHRFRRGFGHAAGHVEDQSPRKSI